MNDIQSSNQALANQVFQQMLQAPTPNKCTCHIIDATKTRILAWPTGQPNNPYLLKIGLQRFIAYNCQDRNQQVYWRFREFEEGVEAKETKSTSQPTITPAIYPKKTALEHHWAPLVSEEKPAPEIEVNRPLSDLPVGVTNRLAKFQARQAQVKENHAPNNIAPQPQPISQ